MGEIKLTKTYQVRDIELNSRVLAALNRQKKACAYLVGAEVFIDPITGRSYVGDKPPRLVWDAALKALGTRHGNAYHES
jgi:integrase